MIKKGIWTILVLALTACTNNLSSEKTQSFTFNQEDWHVTLPEDWTLLPLQEGTLYMAQKQDQNFVVLKRDAQQVDFQKQILESAERDFFFYELIEESPNQWSFKGQVRAALPTRIFEQKFYTRGKNILLGSCSYEVSKTSKSDCEKILKSWQPIEASS